VTWQLVLAGLLIGTLVGLTGMGGGSLMTPILVILFGVNPTVAIGSDIAHGAIFKTVGAFQHRRMGNVRAQLAGWMLLGSAPMSLVGVSLASWLERHYGDSVESVMGSEAPCCSAAWAWWRRTSSPRSPSTTTRLRSAAAIGLPRS